MKKLITKVSLTWTTWLVSIAIAIIYWGFIASDRYVSEAHVVMQSPEILPSNMDFSSVLTGASGAATKDLLLLADHLKSVDMLKKLDKKLDLRSHYSNMNIDYLSRLEDKYVPIEYLHEYYLKRVYISVDEYAGVLRIRAEAFSPETARQITVMLLKGGEQHMNDMGQRLAAEQVNFIQEQVIELGERLKTARNALLEYQNQHGLVSPRATVESLSQVVAGLEAELAKMNAKKTAMADYLSRKSPEMVRLSSEIIAMKKQIALEKAKMTQESGEALNTISAEYETLQLQAKFALELYSNALSALESTRVEAIRKLKQVSVLQAPTFPEYAVKPERIYNITVFIIISILFTLLVQMLLAIIEEHKD
jgi:capsular polysaccharide transport system permease protein